MYYSSGSYEAFARPRKPDGVEDKTAWFVGAGLASMASAAFMIRDGQMAGSRITILERLTLPGGALDGIDEPEKGFDSLYWILTFLNGGRCPVVLPLGFRHIPEPTWGMFGVQKTSAGMPNRSWFPKAAPEEAGKVAEGIHRLLNEEDSREWLTLCIGLYVEANLNASGVDLSLTKAQMALELLASVVTQERNRLLSEEGFDKLPAADRMRVALRVACPVSVSVSVSVS